LANPGAKLPKEAVMIAEGGHPMVQLLKLVEDADEIDDDAWERYKEGVESAYGQDLARAAARKRLAFRKPKEQKSVAPIQAVALPQQDLNEITEEAVIEEETAAPEIALPAAPREKTPERETRHEPVTAFKESQEPRIAPLEVEKAEPRRRVNGRSASESYLDEDEMKEEPFPKASFRPVAESAPKSLVPEAPPAPEPEEDLADEAFEEELEEYAGPMTANGRTAAESVPILAASVPDEPLIDEGLEDGDWSDAADVEPEPEIEEQDEADEDLLGLEEDLLRDLFSLEKSSPLIPLDRDRKILHLSPAPLPQDRSVETVTTVTPEAVDAPKSETAPPAASLVRAELSVTERPVEEAVEPTTRALPPEVAETAPPRPAQPEPIVPETIAPQAVAAEPAIQAETEAASQAETEEEPDEEIFSFDESDLGVTLSEEEFPASLILEETQAERNATESVAPAETAAPLSAATDDSPVASGKTNSAAIPVETPEEPSPAYRNGTPAAPPVEPASEDEPVRTPSAAPVREEARETRTPATVAEREPALKPRPESENGVRAPLSVKGGWDYVRRSPLTAWQERELRESGSGVTVLIGCEAAGIGDLDDFFKTPQNDETLERLSMAMDEDEFAFHLQDSLKHEAPGLKLIVVDPASPWDLRWLEAAIGQTEDLSPESNDARILFAANPTMAWQFLMEKSALLDFLESHRVMLLGLQPWEDSELKNWMDDLHIGGEDTLVRTALSDATGNWPMMLRTFYTYVDRDQMPWREAINAMENQIKDPVGARRIAKSFGLDRPVPQVVLGNLAAGGPMSTEDLASFTEGVTEKVVRAAITWGELLSLASRSKDKIWHLNPFVERLLKAMSVR
jgi:hypothetical protein